MNTNYTTPKQSKQLVDAGLDVDTADMHLIVSNVLGDNDERCFHPGFDFDKQAQERHNGAHVNEKYVPAWSVGQLITLVPKFIFIEGEKEDEADEGQLHIDTYEDWYEVYYRSTYSNETITTANFASENLLEALIEVMVELKKIELA